ncbi:hypothetical protein F4782DRAFT_531944 [Xylaria castorea]|nr:hypothetical protein F4782DRAFT_531944 [Xylaria castorea]
MVDALWGCDSAPIQQGLLQEASRIFASETNQVDYWTAPADDNLTEAPGSIERYSLDGRNPEVPSGNAEQGRDIFFIISQPHSWDRLLITWDTWDRLVTTHHVFPYFAETVLSFGLRTSNDGNTWNNFHSRRSLGLPSDLETCYTIRFFERNNRVGEMNDPWSLRQTGVYHRLHALTGTSVWILIKPSLELKNRLPKKIQAFWCNKDLRNVRHVLVHITILTFSLYGWRDYIATQRLRIEQFEGKSFFSEADVINQNDYRLNFEDRQRLQRLRQKLIKAKSVIDSSLDLGWRLRKILPTMTSQLSKELEEAILMELDDFDAEAKYNKRCIMELEQRSADAAILVSQDMSKSNRGSDAFTPFDANSAIPQLLSILEHRNGNLSLRSTQANEKALTVMMGIAVNSEMEHELEEASSTNVRALTVVATLYLPASLLAGIFSTDLIKSDLGYFVVSNEFWKFIVVLIPMFLVTFAFVYTLQRVWTARNAKRMKMKTQAAREKPIGP